MKQYIIKFFNVLSYPIIDNSKFYFFTFVLSVISIILCPYHSSRLYSLIELLFDVYLLCTILSVIPRKYRGIIKNTIYFVLYLLSIIDTLCYKIMGAPINATIYETFSQTNNKEIIEAFTAYSSFSLLLSPFGLVLVLILIHIILHNYQFTFKKSVAIILSLLTVFSAILSFENKQYLYFVLVERQLDDDQKYQVEFNTLTKDYLPIYRLAIAIKENHRMKKIIEGLDIKAQTVVVDSCTFQSPHIILIIGESYNRHHSSLYGYKYKTTPYQEKRNRLGELMVFTNVISSYNLTNKSFQNMLSLYEYGCSDNWYDYPLFTVLFKKAGYEVCFFSNQFVMDTSISFSNFIEDIFINNPRLSEKQFSFRNNKLYNYDLDLLEDYCKKVGKRKAPRLSIFHFMGLHADFKERYPKSFEHFSANQYNDSELSFAEKQTIAEYDNAILYNDYVIDSILNNFKDDDAIAIFVPDHGEMVYDGCHEFGRSLITDPIRVRAHYDIPFWIWTSNKYREYHPFIWQQVIQAKNRRYMTDQLPHLMLYLGGISCKDYKANHNLIHQTFDSLRHRMIKGEVSYEEVIGY